MKTKKFIITKKKKKKLNFLIIFQEIPSKTTTINTKVRTELWYENNKKLPLLVQSRKQNFR